MKAVLVVVCVLTVTVGASPSRASVAYTTNAVRATGPTAVSSNWSGYALTAADPSTPVTFSDVTGTWVQPRVTCRLGRSDAVAFWVGLGGDGESSRALEQLGTSAECNGLSTTPRYGVWWEIIPAGSVEIGMALKPGDTVTAAVFAKGNRVTLSLKDVTRGTRFSKTVTPAQVDTSSAEWVAEAPSNCDDLGHCRVASLTDFGTVTFRKAATIGDGAPATLANPAWALSPITLITGDAGSEFFGGDGSAASSGVGAVPSDVSADGRSFSVTWQPNVSAGE